MNFLLAIYVLVSLGKGHYAAVRDAIISCDEVRTYEEEEGIEAGTGGEWSPTDSAGRMIFEAPFGSYHCGVSAKGYSGWTGVLTFDEKHRDRAIVLSK